MDYILPREQGFTRSDFESIRPTRETLATRIRDKQREAAGVDGVADIPAMALYDLYVRDGKIHSRTAGTPILPLGRQGW